MADIHKIKKALKKALDKERYEHTMGVMYTAQCLAMAHGVDLEQAQLAGLLHDCAKCIPSDQKLLMCQEHDIPVNPCEKENPSLLHAKLGAYVAENEYDIKDPAILHAIAVHTTGEPNMTSLDKVVFIADYIEPLRNKAEHLPEIRRTAFHHLDEALCMILRDTITFLGKNKAADSVDPMTRETYEFYVGGTLDE
ncbi:MAG: bis(5'-nucleosyl)-tetraphosphatase (symmetrical) YqeK [Roseburia sp.]